jgi:hypothetical protein
MGEQNLKREADGTVQSAEGWMVRFLGPDLLEYCTERAACLVNVGYSPAERARQIYASESSSDLFPHLREHLASAARLFQGQYVVV